MKPGTDVFRYLNNAYQDILNSGNRRKIYSEIADSARQLQAPFKNHAKHHSLAQAPSVEQAYAKLINNHPNPLLPLNPIVDSSLTEVNGKDLQRGKSLSMGKLASNKKAYIGKSSSSNTKILPKILPNSDTRHAKSQLVGTFTVSKPKLHAFEQKILAPSVKPEKPLKNLNAHDSSRADQRPPVQEAVDSRHRRASSADKREGFLITTTKKEKKQELGTQAYTKTPITLISITDDHTVSFVREFRGNTTEKNHEKLIEDLKAKLLQNFYLEIKEGTVVTNSQDFRSLVSVKFRQPTKEPDTGTTAVQDPALEQRPNVEDLNRTIHHIQNFCIKFRVRTAAISCLELMKLVAIKYPSNSQILSAFSHPQVIIKNSPRPIPGMEYCGTDGQQKAAVRIQCFVRGRNCRLYFKKLKTLILKVKYIQRFWKNKYFKIKSKDALKKRAKQRLEIHLRIQEKFRDDWKQIINSESNKTKPKCEIHIYSSNLEELQKLSIASFSQYCNTHLSRVFRVVQDPSLVIIIFTIFPLPIEVKAYYDKMWEMADIPSAKERVHFVSCESGFNQHFPDTISPARLLYYSKSALKRIRKIVQNAPAYIVGGEPSLDLIHISVELNIPILSGSLNKHIYYSTKSGSRRLFTKLHMPTLQGAIDIYSEEQLINTLAIFILKHSQVPRWFIKIDNEVRGRGLGIVNMNVFPNIKNLIRNLEEVQRQVSEEGEGERNSTFPSELQLLSAVAEELSQSLPHKLKLSQRGAYGDYKTFIQAVKNKGCVLQAAPLSQESRINQISVNFRIDPQGNFTLNSVAQKLINAPSSTSNHRTIGCVYPVSQKYDIAYETIAKALYRELYSELLFGYFTLDLLVEELSDLDSRVYCMGLDCHLNERASSFFMAEFITNCSFDTESHLLIPKKSTTEELIAGYERLNSSRVSLKSHPDLGIATNKNPVVLFIPFILERGLSGTSVKKFFQDCRYANISFDVKKRQGLVFMLLDYLQTLGLMSIGTDHQSALAQGFSTVDFLQKNYSGEAAKKLGAADFEGDKVYPNDVKNRLLIQKKRLERVNKKIGKAKLQEQFSGFL